MLAKQNSWSQHCESGMGAIDAQHDSLFSLLDKVRYAVEMQVGNDQMLRVLEAFEHHTLTHFVEEEAFMRETKFPELNAHRQQHQRFLARIVSEKQALIAGSPLTLELIHFLYDWLVDHIQIADKAYAEHVQQKKDNTLLSRFFRYFG